MVDGRYYMNLGHSFKNTETRPAKYGQWFLYRKLWHMYDYSQWLIEAEWRKGHIRGVELYRLDYTCCGKSMRNATMTGKGKEAMAKKGVCKECQRAYLDWMRIEGTIGEHGGVDLGGGVEAAAQYWKEYHAEKAQEPKETPWYDL